MKTSEILRGAAAVIREKGWTRKVLTNQAGEVCALGAINTIVHGYAEYPYAWTRDRSRDNIYWRDMEDAAEAVARRLGIDPEQSSSINGVVHWNNEYGRTADEVIDIFESTADELDFGTPSSSVQLCDSHEPCTTTVRCRVHVAPVAELSPIQAGSQS